MSDPETSAGGHPDRSAQDVITATILTKIDADPRLVRNVALDVIFDLFAHGWLVVLPEHIPVLHAAQAEQS